MYCCTHRHIKLYTYVKATFGIMNTVHEVMKSRNSSNMNNELPLEIHLIRVAEVKSTIYQLSTYFLLTLPKLNGVLTRSRTSTMLYPYIDVVEKVICKYGQWPSHTIRIGLTGSVLKSGKTT